MQWHLGFHKQSLTPAGRGFTSSLGFLGGGEDHFNQCNSCGNAGPSDNAPGGGACTLGDSNLLGTPCTLSAQCGSGGFCSTNQEDGNSNGVGDAGERTLLPEPAANGLLAGGLLLLWALARHRHALNA